MYHLHLPSFFYFIPSHYTLALPTSVYLLSSTFSHRIQSGLRSLSSMFTSSVLAANEIRWRIQTVKYIPTFNCRFIVL